MDIAKLYESEYEHVCYMCEYHLRSANQYPCKICYDLTTEDRPLWRLAWEYRYEREDFTEK